MNPKGLPHQPWELSTDTQTLEARFDPYSSGPSGDGAVSICEPVTSVNLMSETKDQ